MYRKQLVELLKQKLVTAQELASHFGVRPKDIEQELEHVLKSVKKDGMKLVVEPAKCRKCNFVFKRDKLDKPTRCPKCKSEWIAAARFTVDAG